MTETSTTSKAADVLRQRAEDADAFARLVDELGVTTGDCQSRIALHRMSRADFDAVIGATGAQETHYEGAGERHDFWAADVLVGIDVVCEVYTREPPVEIVEVTR